jgi:hypothetical protein
MNRKKFILAWLALSAVAALAAAATHWLLCGAKPVTQEQLSNTSYLTAISNVPRFGKNDCGLDRGRFFPMLSRRSRGEREKGKS